MPIDSMELQHWAESRIHPEEVDRYLRDGRDFLDDDALGRALSGAHIPDDARLQALLAKSLSGESLGLAEAAELMMVKDPDQRRRMDQAALAVKIRIYDKCVAVFSPLYLGNACVNACSYCGFKDCANSNTRRVLSEAEIKAEVEVLAGQVGHRRLMAVYGEHPSTDAKYIADSLAAIYSVQAPQGSRYSDIRCVSVNAPPMSIADLKQIKAAGPGAYHAYQVTYDRAAYQTAHPSGPKADFRWRLYGMHRAMEAGIAQVGLGILAGLADWRFEILGLMTHAFELETRYDRGPQVIILQRLDPAHPASDPANRMDEDEFLRMVTVLRLALPYVGIQVNSAEGAEVRRKALQLGITQTDAAPGVSVGAFHEGGVIPSLSCRQFALGDPSPLQDVVKELGEGGQLTSFCSPSFRSKRQGKDYMASLRSGNEGLVCKMNAVLTYKEWLDDFADAATKATGERLLEKEMASFTLANPDRGKVLQDAYRRTSEGERGLYF